VRPPHPIAGQHFRGISRPRLLSAVILILSVVAATIAAVLWSRASGPAAPTDLPKIAELGSGPPPKGGYFATRPAGQWAALPGDAACAAQVHLSTWEPRPDNARPNQVEPDAAAAHRALAIRPVSGKGAADPRWDSWLRQRIDGQFTGTTDEIFQWAACKWGLSDDVLRAISVVESTWYQYNTYPSGRPVSGRGSGDLTPPGTAGAAAYCDAIARFGHDYQKDYGPGVCPETFSIVGVKSWQAPSWGAMPDNQNGTFPFVRDSTAYAVDYLAAHLRGCYNGWEYWLAHTGPYRAGDISGCVGAWYAGAWRTVGADRYIGEIKAHIARSTWLQSDWPTAGYACDPTYGCPGPGRH
jgi:hypothetical protein